MASNADRIRQAEMDAARTRELEEERLLLIQSRSSANLPSIDQFVQRNMASRVVRSYVREVMVPDSLKRLYDIGHGHTQHDTVVGFEIVKMEAPPAVQVAALRSLVAVGVPTPKPGDDGIGKAIGVLALGVLELGQARERATAQRLAEQGPVAQIGRGGYVAPEGHELVVVEERFDSAQRDSDSDAPAPARPRKPSKHQSLAAKRRDRLKTRGR